MSELGAGKNVPEVFNVVVEIQRGGHNKYELDKETGYLTLDRVNPIAMDYPIDYGYIPGTMSDDGDAIDALLVIDEPIPHNVVAPCRAIGLLRMVDTGENDEKIICVAAEDETKSHIKSVEDLGPNFKPRIEHYFKHYKDWKKDWKGVDVHFESWGSTEEAKQALMDSIKRYEEQV